MSKIYIIAAENSADYMGSKIIQEFSKINPNTKFFGIGGPKMEHVGFLSLIDMQELNIMGLIEVLPKLFKLNSLINKAAQDILNVNPDLVITIDAPSFNLRVVKLIRKLGFNKSVVHVVAPSVWAYKAHRSKIFAKYYDHLFAILPFEPPLFIKDGLNTSYVGHPIFEQDFAHSKNNFRTEHNIQKNAKLVCITPGSRKQEIVRHLVIFLDGMKLLSKHYSNLVVVLVAADESARIIIQDILDTGNWGVRTIIVNSESKLGAYAESDVALAKSGTNTLEIAACDTPMIVAYKMHPISFMLADFLLKVKYASLINIVADREVIPEFLQKNCTAKNLSEAIHSLLANKQVTNNQLKEVKQALIKMGLRQKETPTSKIVSILSEQFLR